VIALSREVRRDGAALARDYIRKDRAEAVGNLLAAIDQAAAQISADPGGGLNAPRPYPAVARPGRAWTKAGRYWSAYTLGNPQIILAVFYDAANIPDRI